METLHTHFSIQTHMWVWIEKCSTSDPYIIIDVQIVLRNIRQNEKNNAIFSKSRTTAVCRNRKQTTSYWNTGPVDYSTSKTIIGSAGWVPESVGLHATARTSISQNRYTTSDISLSNVIWGVKMCRNWVLVLYNTWTVPWGHLCRFRACNFTRCV